MVPLWALSVPLPAVVLMAVCAYMLLLGVALWGRHCLKVECGAECCACCDSVSVCDYCLTCAEACDVSVPSVRSCLDACCPSNSCPTCPTCSAPSCPDCPSCPAPTCPALSWPCGGVDLTCTCQRPQCDTINCFCCEGRIGFRSSGPVASRACGEQGIQ
ncbi:uncharacterized protein si:ch211-198p11.6 [Engraulis encrasicolus]|uniref:uncharacterized protein si:ch211-198p11.6 n=1 Tax=Engraulis encrasicolus TaxID=184585 RepID=UPI002FD41BFA